MDHIFSVELNEQKRALLMKEHPKCHVFSDVQIFHTGSGHCYRCGTTHTVTSTDFPIDVFICGPSCKDISRLNTSRQEKVGCYQESAGNSAAADCGSSKTYKLGFLKVLDMFCPALAIYENVKAATEKSKDAAGKLHPAPVEAHTFAKWSSVYRLQES